MVTKPVLIVCEESHKSGAFYENTEKFKRFLFLHTKGERVTSKPLQFIGAGESELLYSRTCAWGTRDNVQDLLKAER